MKAKGHQSMVTEFSKLKTMKNLIPFALTFALIILGQTVFGQLENSIKRLIVPEEGGTISIQNNKGDTITLSIPRYALRDPVEIELTALNDTESCPIDSISFKGIKIEPHLLFYLPVKLEIRLNEEKKIARDIMIFRLNSPTEVKFQKTDTSGNNRLTCFLMSTSTYLAGVPSLQEINKIIEDNLNRPAPEPNSMEEQIQVYDMSLGLEESLRIFDPNGARNIRKNMINSMLVKIPEFLNQPVPVNPCGDYLQELLNLRFITNTIGSIIMSEMLDFEDFSFMTDEELESYLNDFYTENFGSVNNMDLFGELEISFQKKIDSFINNCPPLRTWEISIEHDENGYLDFMSTIPIKIKTNLTKRIVYKADNTIKDSVYLSSKVTVSFGDQHTYCYICQDGTYNTDFEYYIINGFVEEDGTIDFIGSYKKPPIITIQCNKNPEIDDDADCFLASLFRHTGDNSAMVSIWIEVLTKVPWNGGEFTYFFKENKVKVTIGLTRL